MSKSAKDLVGPAAGKAFILRKGWNLRITTPEGPQVGDFVIFGEQNLNERFSQARTKANQGTYRISTRDRLYSRDNNVMFTIVEDTLGEFLPRSSIPHDLQYGMCSRWVFENVGYIREAASSRPPCQQLRSPGPETGSC